MYEKGEILKVQGREKKKNPNNQKTKKDALHT